MTIRIVFPTAYANVYLARKNGGVDNGTLYALKAVNLTFALKIEEQILYEDILINERNVIRFHSNEREQNEFLLKFLFRFFFFPIMICRY